MRLATLDLGTNTVRLLVADVAPDRAGWRVVEHDQRVTRLGEGLADRGVLGEAAMARTEAVVLDYVARARRAGAERVQVVATSAVREADNGRAFAYRLARATGAPVRVVSGDEEARLMLRGALHGLPPAAGVTLVFDVGGGSTEYVLTEAGAVRAAVSLRLGVVPLAERYPFPGPVEATRYRELSAEIAGRLARELPPAIRAAEPARVVGTAGTVTTLAALDLGLTRYDSARVHGHRLALDAVERLRARLAALDVAGRAALPCLEPGRADVIVAGTAIVLATLACVGARSLLASDFGVREGLLLEP